MVFVVLALAMFDVILIDFSPLARGPDTQGKRGSFALAFTMGAVAALLAGACVAPVVIQVVLFASSLYAGGTTIALALPFVLGLGMALPWPFAGAGIACAAEAGAWMVRVKQVIGVLILATAVYYGYLAWTLFENRRVDAGAVSRSVQEKLQDRLDVVARRRARAGRARAEARAHRLLGDVVQELPDHGRHDVRGRGRRGGPRSLREDQGPGRGPRRRAREGVAARASRRSACPPTSSCAPA